MKILYTRLLITKDFQKLLRLRYDYHKCWMIIKVRLEKYFGNFETKNTQIIL